MTQTPEDVARLIVDRWRFEGLGERSDDTLKAYIASALRNVQQETREECAKIASLQEEIADRILTFPRKSSPGEGEQG